MADEAVYGAGGESNKRKYDDSPPPVARRVTGFSSAPDFAAPPSSYNSVPPPLNEIELAKQKAQEIAARLLNNSDPSKRARVENTNGAGYVGGGFDAFDAGSGPKHSGLGLSGPLQSASYGYPGPSKTIEIPNGKVGMIIGKGGDTIKSLQLDSGAKIQVTRDTEADPNSATRAVELTGAPDEIAKAEQMINDILSQADTGGSSLGNMKFTGQAAGTERFSMMVPNNKVGLVIGKGGETIKSMQSMSGARIQVIPLHLPPGDMSKERTVQIDGSNEQIEAAKQMIEEVTSENRMRNQSMGGGGYNTQQGYQSRPPTNWSQPGLPMQQPAYGYAQPGGYSVPPQYNMNQQQPNYPSYPPTSGGYATSWDPSMAPQNQQTGQGGGSYDYYSQQQLPTQQQQTQGGSTDGSGYNYQAQAYSQGQGYGQDGYGYNYGQTQTNPIAGYNQQQQGYNNAAYGNISNPATDGQPPSYEKQSDSNQAPAQPSPNPKDPHQGSTQSGYGTHGGYGTQPPSGYGSNVTPQTQKPSGQPAAYVQPQQSPTSQGGGYAQYSQAPPVQLGYSQADAGAQRPPASQPGYAPPPYGAPPAAQPGYGAPPYAAPPLAQPGYGQHPYGSGYGGGYSTQQAPAYSADATAPQPAGAPGATKASPPS